MAENEQTFPSTTWAWKRVKMRSSAGGQRDSSRVKRGFRRLGRYPRSEALRITVKYRGGAEAWWLVQARGCVEAFPGHLAFEDVMRRVYSEN